MESIEKYICHGRFVQDIANDYGWLPGARYTNLRDIRHLGEVSFIDIDWQNYSFEKHLQAVKTWKPKLTVARDILRFSELPLILKEADELLNHSQQVILVPKDPRLKNRLNKDIPSHFLLGYSIPSRYGSSEIAPQFFDRPVHLLGGTPMKQLAYAKEMEVVSIDCNRFTLDAKYGDYFDGVHRRRHPIGGYEECLRASFENINKAWRAFLDGDSICGQMEFAY